MTGAIEHSLAMLGEQALELAPPTRGIA
jgi:hypothetical protein